MAESGTFKPTSGPDDGYVFSDGTGFSNSEYYVAIGQSSKDIYMFCRFPSVTIPQGATIQSAVLNFRPYTNGDGGAFNFDIAFHDADDVAAADIDSGAEITGASLATSVTWDFTNSWATGTTYTSSDISAALQDVIDRAGWESGNAVCVQVRDDGSSDDYHLPVAYDAYGGSQVIELEVTWQDGEESADGLGVADQVEAEGEFYPSLADGLGVADTITAEGGSTLKEVADGFGISDFIESFGGSTEHEAADGFGIADDVSTSGNIQNVESPDTFGIDDQTEAGFEYNAPCENSEFGVDDAASVLNWSDFLRDNADKYVIKYFCTLTGSADGLDDQVLPMTSFQARKRNGEATYLGAVIPGVDYYDEIADRSNGEIVIEMAYFLSGVEQLREEILRVDLETIDFYKGARQRSLQITGHKTQSFATNLVELTDPTYKSIINGKLLYRFSQPDPWLNPGDTALVSSEGDEFRVDHISYIVSVQSKTMEVSEI